MALISGLSGYVQGANGVPGSAGTFGKWRVRTRTVKPKMNNFKSGFQRVVSGLLGAEVQIEGPWDVGALGVTAGAEVTLVLGVTLAVFLTVTAVIDWEASNDVEDAPRITITGDSDGAFTITAA